MNKESFGHRSSQLMLFVLVTTKNCSLIQRTKVQKNCFADHSDDYFHRSGRFLSRTRQSEIKRSGNYTGSRSIPRPSNEFFTMQRRKRSARSFVRGRPGPCPISQGVGLSRNRLARHPSSLFKLTGRENVVD